MKYYFGDKEKESDFTCPICGESKSFRELACERCFEVWREKEPSLPYEKWVFFNVWCNRLPFMSKIFKFIKIWRFEDPEIRTFWKYFTLLLIIPLILVIVGCLS